jgi:hypothetical protein
MPGFDQASTLQETSLFRKVVRTSGARPWPFKRDELMLVN